MASLGVKEQVANILQCALADIDIQDGQESKLLWDSLVHVQLMIFLEEQGLAEITEETMTKYTDIDALRRLLS